ncbi:hypothetical protein [Neptuniibacter halophilus]|uniref:hypothetical protein n=1 Tax=Neptuniibacter halophilus TaxID=651666 RepID=UPI0025744234|nr:hypothetical protein [Neptuniibacter halophilus]
MAARSFWGKIRLTLLLLLLLVVSLNALLSRIRSSDWEETLILVIYPINADERQDTQQYLDALSEEHFEEIEWFLRQQAALYGLSLTDPLRVHLAPPVNGHPPPPPLNPSMLDSVIWSLELRYWAWRNDNWQGESADIRVYLRLFSPQNRQVLAHSLGLQKGMIGVVNGFASIDYQAQNNFVTLHEVLHTLGARDKYDPATNQPLWPEGYADPYQYPRLPQYRAEIMGGRVPETAAFSLIPSSLQQVMIGPQTAAEINWITD